jgi:formate dehydrogenase iron-sulfur subunit
MKRESLQTRIMTPGTVMLLILMAAGIGAAGYRYLAGLGAATNLSDHTPWGLWVAVDVYAGVALAAGSFTVAALVFIFGGIKYHVLVRPAVLTGLLGYIFVAIALLIDLGQPLHIWYPIIRWPEHSIMFEVAWCVILYMTVLALEFMPAILERFKWTRVQAAWHKFIPVVSIAALALFAGVMALSWYWALGALILFGALELMLHRGAAQQPEVPVLLIIAGIVFSTMHQSSLGAVLLLMPEKLDRLWWTPALPVNFFLSAVAAGFAIVIVETVLSARVFRLPDEHELLAGMGRFLAYALWIYLAFRLADMAYQGRIADVPVSSKAMLFLLEILPGVLIPACLLSSRLRNHAAILFTAALLVVLGIVFNRINVVWLALNVPGEAVYFPSLLEILITVSIIAAIIFFFTVAVKTLPVFSSEPEQSPG